MVRLLTSEHLRTACERMMGWGEVVSGMFRVFVRMLLGEGWEAINCGSENLLGEAFMYVGKCR